MPRSSRLARLSSPMARASARCWAKCFRYSSGMSSGGSVSLRKRLYLSACEQASQSASPGRE
eukprot:3957343-Alexandrium_andersonii.AAC.1